MYRKHLGRVVANPLLRSGVKLGKRVNLFNAMQAVGKPVDIATLAKETNTKETYLAELVRSYVSSQVVEMTDDSKIFVPDWSAFNEMFVTKDIEYIRPLELVAPTLEKCFTTTGPAGYSHDDAPHVMNYVRSLRANYNQSIAKELAMLITTHTEKYKNILDVGCGTGDITTPLAVELLGAGSTVLGCDVSEMAILEAEIGSRLVENISFTKTNIDKLPESWTRKFDVVIMFDVLHDLQHPVKAMEQVMKVLSDTGIVIIVDPKVSSNPLKNIGNIQAAQALTLSAWWCIPSSSCDHGSGNGVGWGWENKEEFLKKAGLEIKSRICLIKSDYNYAYVCTRKK